MVKRGFYNTNMLSLYLSGTNVFNLFEKKNKYRQDLPKSDNYHITSHQQQKTDRK